MKGAYVWAYSRLFEIQKSPPHLWQEPTGTESAEHGYVHGRNSTHSPRSARFHFCSGKASRNGTPGVTFSRVAFTARAWVQMTD